MTTTGRSGAPEALATSRSGASDLPGL